MVELYQKQFYICFILKNRFNWSDIKILPAKDALEDKNVIPRILNCISRYFDSCSADQKKDIHTVLSSKNCIPADNGGLMKPTEVRNQLKFTKKEYQIST